MEGCRSALHAERLRDTYTTLTTHCTWRSADTRDLAALRLVWWWPAPCSEAVGPVAQPVAN